MDELVPKETWTVRFTGTARKQKERLPEKIAARFLYLTSELTLEGPIQPEWSHFGKLTSKKNKLVYHCHLNKNKPVYVVVWEVIDCDIKILKIVYAGTHESADYKHWR
jgi:mRNA-degrading endonuclease RelE of RelBE toxin-antitoxin system